MNVTDLKERGREASYEPQLRVAVTAGADGTHVVPQGELDIASAPDLEAVLVAQTGRAVVDLRELTFVDAAGLRVLFDAETRSRRDGLHLRFIAGPAVERLLEAAGVRDELTCVERPPP